ncbi:cobalamin biosynthesis protein [Seohaeicola zhoushanensis]
MPPRARPDALAAPTDKCATPAFRAFAGALGLPVHEIPEAAIRAAQTLTHSPRVQAERGTGSVAEAAALSAVGKGRG